MARKLRIEYPNARYHVINRGNYRSDIYASEGAAQSFLKTVMEAVERFGWRLHAYVIMRNHYHLAIETPRANLTAGMQWLQTTAATRFNRFRKENGHVFQGRYKALVLEDTAALCNVVDYIHLNPVRAGAVTAERVGEYRWSSLRSLIENKCPKGLVCAEWIEARGSSRGGWKDDARGIADYVAYLKDVGADERLQKELGIEGLSRGWAIGTHGWKAALAREYSHRALSRGIEKQEIAEIHEAHWRKLLEAELSKAGKATDELNSRFRCPEWKLKMALGLQSGGVPIRWIAEQLKAGGADSLRSRLSGYRKKKE
jgi:REP element-mobilizing transposase RayT